MEHLYHSSQYVPPNDYRPQSRAHSYTGTPHTNESDQSDMQAVRGLLSLSPAGTRLPPLRTLQHQSPPILSRPSSQHSQMNGYPSPDRRHLLFPEGRMSSQPPIQLAPIEPTPPPSRRGYYRPEMDAFDSDRPVQTPPLPRSLPPPPPLQQRHPSPPPPIVHYAPPPQSPPPQPTYVDAHKPSRKRKRKGSPPVGLFNPHHAPPHQVTFEEHRQIQIPSTLTSDLSNSHASSSTLPPSISQMVQQTPPPIQHQHMMYQPPKSISLPPTPERPPAEPANDAPCRVCESNADTGNAMIACDSCGIWHHNACVRLPEVIDEVKEWLCFHCNVKVSPTKVRRRSGRDDTASSGRRKKQRKGVGSEMPPIRGLEGSIPRESIASTSSLPPAQSFPPPPSLAPAFIAHPPPIEEQHQPQPLTQAPPVEDVPVSPPSITPDISISPWHPNTPHTYVPIDRDVIAPEARPIISSIHSRLLQARGGRKISSALWDPEDEDVLALEEEIDVDGPDPPSQLEERRTQIRPVPSASAMRPAQFSLHTTSDLIPDQPISRYVSEVVPSKAYLSDPLNAYVTSALPKPYVRLTTDLALDARRSGNEARWARRGCHPNSVIRPTICKNSRKGTPGSGDEGSESEKEKDVDGVQFMLFATQDMKEGDEIVLGWEWDDGHVIHQLPAIIESRYAGMGIQSHRRHTLKATMKAFLDSLADTFQSCACGTQSRDCAVNQLASFVEDRESPPPPSHKPKPNLGKLVGTGRGVKGRPDGKGGARLVSFKKRPDVEVIPVPEPKRNLFTRRSPTPTAFPSVPSTLPPTKAWKADHPRAASASTASDTAVNPTTTEDSPPPSSNDEQPRRGKKALRLPPRILKAKGLVFKHFNIDIPEVDKAKEAAASDGVVIPGETKTIADPTGIVEEGIEALRVDDAEHDVVMSEPANVDSENAMVPEVEMSGEADRGTDDPGDASKEVEPEPTMEVEDDEISNTESDKAELARSLSPLTSLPPDFGELRTSSPPADDPINDIDPTTSPAESVSQPVSNGVKDVIIEDGTTRRTPSPPAESPHPSPSPIPLAAPTVVPPSPIVEVSDAATGVQAVTPTPEENASAPGAPSVSPTRTISATPDPDPIVSHQCSELESNIAVSPVAEEAPTPATPVEPAVPAKKKFSLAQWKARRAQTTPVIPVLEVTATPISEASAGVEGSEAKPEPASPEGVSDTVNGEPRCNYEAEAAKSPIAKSPSNEDAGDVGELSNGKHHIQEAGRKEEVVPVTLPPTDSAVVADVAAAPISTFEDHGDFDQPTYPAESPPPRAVRVNGNTSPNGVESRFDSESPARYSSPENATQRSAVNVSAPAIPDRPKPLNLFPTQPITGLPVKVEASTRSPSPLPPRPKTTMSKDSAEDGEILSPYRNAFPRAPPSNPPTQPRAYMSGRSSPPHKTAIRPPSTGPIPHRLPPSSRPPPTGPRALRPTSQPPNTNANSALLPSQPRGRDAWDRDRDRDRDVWERREADRRWDRGRGRGRI